MSELKPCPFCSGEADLVEYGLTGEREVVQCSDCGARTRSFDPKVKRGENAIDAWNMRVYDDDCISRQAAIDAIIEAGITEYDETLAIEQVEKVPSVQPEIIRCKDCKHRGEKPIADGRYWCELHDTFMYYCSDAERREE